MPLGRSRVAIEKTYETSAQRSLAVSALRPSYPYQDAHAVRSCPALLVDDRVDAWQGLSTPCHAHVHCFRLSLASEACADSIIAEH
jgi:hypothetical protein